MCFVRIFYIINFGIELSRQSYGLVYFRSDVFSVKCSREIIKKDKLNSVKPIILLLFKEINWLSQEWKLILVKYVVIFHPNDQLVASSVKPVSKSGYMHNLQFIINVISNDNIKWKVNEWMLNRTYAYQSKCVLVVRSPYNPQREKAVIIANV